MFNPLDGMDALRKFIIDGIVRDAQRANVLQQMKAPHAYAAPMARPHYDRKSVEALRRPKRITSGPKAIIEAPSLIGSAPHGRLFKGHRP